MSENNKIEETVYKRAPIAKKISKEKIATLTIKNKKYEFTSKSIIIGRDKSCNIVLDDPLVSRKHAKIWKDEDNKKKYYIEDLNSTNGTYVNNNPVLKGKKKELKKGDEIRLGNTILIFNFDEF